MTEYIVTAHDYIARNFKDHRNPLYSGMVSNEPVIGKNGETTVKNLFHLSNLLYEDSQTRGEKITFIVPPPQNILDISDGESAVYMRGLTPREMSNLAYYLVQLCGRPLNEIELAFRELRYSKLRGNITEEMLDREKKGEL